MTIDRKKSFDMLFLTSLLLLIVTGILLVYSATHLETNEILRSRWFRQIIHFIGGGIVAGIVVLIPTRFYYGIAYPLYFLSLLSLLFVAFMGGESSHGAGRWISLGFMNVQPSELAKIAYLFAISRMLSGKKVGLQNLKSFILPGVLFAIPFLLILKQPDLSTALVFVAMTLIGFFWSGMGIIEIFVLISPVISVITSFNQLIWTAFIVLVFGAMWKLHLHLKLFLFLIFINLSAGYGSFVLWNKVLKHHQRERIMTFVDPLKDPKGAGYQVIQSRVAIGSGGITGKGFGKGSQTNLSFLPEEHTDFIFSVLGEQFGLVGGFIVFLLYFVLFQRIFHIAAQTTNRFANNLVVISGTILVFHVFVNISMTLGMMPVTGLPLPFLSYGGSFVLTCMVLVGLVLNVKKNSKDL